MTILAFGSWKNNAQLVLGTRQLGYLHDDWRICDPTYGEGRFWKLWQPRRLVASDLDPTKSPAGQPIDFTALPYPDDSFDAAVLDGPYKLNGTSTGEGPSASDIDYGVAGEYSTVHARHRLICAGITELARTVAPARRIRVDRGRTELDGGTVLVKCMDQVCCGRIWWQTRIFADHAESVGLVLEDMLHLPGYRPQPERSRRHGDCAGKGCDHCNGGRVPSRQHHAGRNYSSLLILRRPPA